MRSLRFILILLALAGEAEAGRRLDRAIIVRIRNDNSLPGIEPALASTLASAGVPAASVKTVELSGDGAADTATLARETRQTPTVFAIGAYATTTAGHATGPENIVGVAVANPARLGVDCTYVSLYPRYDLIFRYISQHLGAKSVGVLYSTAQNREVAEAIFRASGTRSVSVVPVGVSSGADLVRKLPAALARVDALLLTVDPLLFDRRSLEYIVAESQKAKKPTIGFLDQLASVGVTINLVTEAVAIATVAVSAASDDTSGGRRRLHVDDVRTVVARAPALRIGLDPGRLGADEIR